MSFKLDSIIMLIVEHFYFIKFKPNEYSLENYQLAMQIRTAELIHKLYTLLFYFKQTLLWLNMRLIENCIMRLENKSLDEDERFIQMSTHYEEQRLKCKSYIDDLNKKVNALKVKDAEFMMCPELQNVRAKLGDMNPMQDIAEKLKSINIDYCPTNILESLEDHIGFKLTNDNKDRFPKRLEELFCKSEEEFVQFYDSHRLSYLKA